MYINTTFFPLDKGVRDELLRAIRDRHVEVLIINPGRKSDHGMTRSSSRALYGEPLKAGPGSPSINLP